MSPALLAARRRNYWRAILLASPVAVGVAVAACGATARPPQGTPSPDASADVSADVSAPNGSTVHDASSGPTTPLPASSRSTELKTTKLELADAAPAFEELDPGALITLPAEYEGFTQDPPRWLSHGMPGFVLRVHDRATGRALGEIEGADLRNVSESLGVVNGYRRRSPALLRLVDGRMLVPQPTAPGGGRAVPEQVLVPVDVANGDVVVVARRNDGTLAYGFWDDRSSPNVELTHALPRGGKRATWNRSSSVWELDGPAETEAEERCPRVRLRRVGPQCIGSNVKGALSPLWLGDWAAVGFPTSGLVHATMGAVVATSNPRAHVVAALVEPVRALFAWQAEGSDERVLEVLSPEGSRGRFRYRHAPTGFLGNHADQNKLVIDEGSLEASGAPSSFFVDLENGEVFLTEPLEVAVSSSRERRLLAVRRGPTRDTLVLLDFDRRTAVALGSMDHCSGGYEGTVLRGALASVKCTRPTGPRGVHRGVEWSVLVDRDAHKGFRVKAPWSALDVLPDGRVLFASKPERPTGPLRARVLPWQ